MSILGNAATKAGSFLRKVSAPFIGAGRNAARAGNATVRAGRYTARMARGTGRVIRTAAGPGITTARLAYGVSDAAYRVLAYEPGGRRALLNRTAHGLRLNPTLVRRGVGALMVGGMAYGAATYTPPVEYYGGLPEVRRNNDLSATGSLNFAWYDRVKSGTNAPGDLYGRITGR